MTNSLFQILIDADGIAVQDLSQQELRWRVAWADVKEIVAWKEDVFSHDIICLGFRELREPFYHQCDEQMSGWVMLQVELEKRFGISWDQWWGKVALPAFERNWTVLWGEAWPLPCANCGYDLRASAGRCPECGAKILSQPAKLYD